MKKLFIIPLLFCLSGALNAAINDPLSADLPLIGVSEVRGYETGVAVPAAPAAPLQRSREDDAVLGALTDAQWDAILSGQPWEPAPFSSKELFSDFQIRYIARGRVSFKTEPPLFTTRTGRVFRLVNYPPWLREAGDTPICVEGYLKQRDDASEFKITRMLPPDALDILERTPEMRALERDPYIMSRRGGRYLLGNVNWNIRHDSAGNRIRDAHGNMLSKWESGVTVKPELLENVYFVKKSDLKPVKHGGHGLLMFTFKPGGVVTADGRLARGLTITLDGYHKSSAEMAYDIVAALKGKYTVYYTIQTIERYTEYRVAERPEVMYPYPLRLSRPQQLRLLDAAIAKATEKNVGEMYDLIYNSCANSILSIINSVLEDGRKIKAGWLPEIIYRVRTAAPDAIAALLLKKKIAERPLPEINGRNFRETVAF